jgi:hypothetical protein
VHYWNVKAAAHDLREHRLSEWEKVRYLIAAAILQLVLAAVPRFLFGNYSPSTPGVLGYFIAMAVVVIGFRTLFRLNAQGDGIDFITRYMVLAFPATVRVSAVFWLLYLGLLVVSGVYGWADSKFWIAFALFSNPLYYGTFFWQVAIGIKEFKA